MDLNPQRVRTAEFKSTKRGLDPDEVRRFLGDVADELEKAQNQSTAMEARARAAVARLQELSDGASNQAAASQADDVGAASVEQAETISRTLLLAQRTADTTIAQAESESDRLVTAASEEAASTLDSTREMAARLMEEAREEARRVGETERLSVASEVDSLKARRDFLESDVDHLEQFLSVQRERLRGTADAMIELTERVTNGLGEVRQPLLSAADDEHVESGEHVTDDPTPAESAHAEPVLADQTPADPVAAEPEPSDPTPAEQAPSEPESSDPASSDPTPAGTTSSLGERIADADAAAAVDEAGAEAPAGDLSGGVVGEVDPGVAAPLEFPADETDTNDPTPSFVLGHDTGEAARPDDDEGIRFSFDDRR